MDSLDNLRDHFGTTALLSTTMATLEWDERTGLPAEGASYRADQITLLSGMIHARRTDVRIGEWLDDVEASLSTLPEEKRSLTKAAHRCWKKDYLRDTRLPQSLVEALARAITLGQNAWSVARPKNDYASFVPHLREIIRLRREEASLLKTTEAPLYDVLLDQYEEGASRTRFNWSLTSLRSRWWNSFKACSILRRLRLENG